jgi:hypothetical protein
MQHAAHAQLLRSSNIKQPSQKQLLRSSNIKHSCYAAATSSTAATQQQHQATQPETAATQQQHQATQPETGALSQLRGKDQCVMVTYKQRHAAPRTCRGSKDVLTSESAAASECCSLPGTLGAFTDSLRMLADLCCCSLLLHLHVQSAALQNEHAAS